VPALIVITALAALSPDECVLASTQGQELRQAGKLSQAKQAFEGCGDPSCPTTVRAACTEWLEGVLNDMPSLVIVVRVDGEDRSAARVALDGKPWVTDLNGSAQPLDPGEHDVFVEAATLSQTQHLVVNVGEKNRRVVFELSSPPKPKRSMDGPLGFTISAGAALLIGTGFGIAGRVTQDQLTGSPCAATMTCDPSRVTTVRALYLVADVFFVVAVVSAGVGAWRWWLYLH
jgi:hypothetical protein